MRKIPTLFVRDPKNRARVLDEVTPGCEWVLAGEGVATRKFDGTSVLIRGGQMFKRREVKPDRPLPLNFVEVEHDKTTGKRVGWVPVDPMSAVDRWHVEAFNADPKIPDGTYELVGPKVQGNPEKFPTHTLVAHGAYTVEAPRTFAALAEWLAACPYEGVVWHHLDGRMAKLKRRDFTSAERVAAAGEAP